jgi:hypothetical protein
VIIIKATVITEKTTAVKKAIFLGFGALAILDRYHLLKK